MWMCPLRAFVWAHICMGPAHHVSRLSVSVCLGWCKIPDSLLGNMEVPTRAVVLFPEGCNCPDPAMNRLLLEERLRTDQDGVRVEVLEDIGLELTDLLTPGGAGPEGVRCPPPVQ